MMQSLQTFLGALSAILLLGAVQGASAQAVVSTGDSFVTPRLLPGEVIDGGGRMAGLRLSLAPGWKTYWRSPGETGIPPRFDWSGSENIRAVEIHWPKPVVFESFGMQTVGYSDVVLFPLEVMPEDPAKPIVLDLSAELGVCREICVLEHVEVSLGIAPDQDEVGARQIRSALRQVPKAPAREVAHVAHCQIERKGKGHRLTASLMLAQDGPRPMVLVENLQGLWLRRTTQTQTDTGVAVSVDFALPEGASWIDRSAFRMTVLSSPFAYDLQGCSTP